MLQFLKKAFPIFLGAGIGYAYWYFIGCLNGSCPITGNWHTATAYGAIVGATFLLPTRKKRATEGESPNTVTPDAPGGRPSSSPDNVTQLEQPGKDA